MQQSTKTRIKFRFLTPLWPQLLTPAESQQALTDKSWDTHIKNIKKQFLYILLKEDGRTTFKLSSSIRKILTYIAPECWIPCFQKMDDCSLVHCRYLFQLWLWKEKWPLPESKTQARQWRVRTNGSKRDWEELQNKQRHMTFTCFLTYATNNVT